jgi:hypothetical protein
MMNEISLTPGEYQKIGQATMLVFNPLTLMLLQYAASIENKTEREATCQRMASVITMQLIDLIREITGSKIKQEVRKN